MHSITSYRDILQYSIFLIYLRVVWNLNMSYATELDLFPVKGDGDCYPRAVFVALYGREPTPKEIKELKAKVSCGTQIH